MDCLLLNQTLSAKVLQEGRKEREGGQLGGCQREELRRQHEQLSLERCDSSSSPFPLRESQPILLLPCPKFHASFAALTARCEAEAPKDSQLHCGARSGRFGDTFVGSSSLALGLLAAAMTCEIASPPLASPPAAESCYEIRLF